MESGDSWITLRFIPATAVCDAISLRVERLELSDSTRVLTKNGADAPIVSCHHVASARGSFVALPHTKYLRITHGFNYRPAHKKILGSKVIAYAGAIHSDST